MKGKYIKSLMFWRCCVLSVKVLLPWEDEKDKNGDAGGQDDFSFCVQLSVTLLAPAPAHHHLVSLALAQETPWEQNNGTVGCLDCLDCYIDGLGC